jgi:hypothetical protein
MNPELTTRLAARFWSAPALWRYSKLDCADQSGRGLPQSKTLSRECDYLSQP